MSERSLSEARQQLLEIVNKVAYLTKKDKKIAAIVSIEVLEDMIDIEEAKKALKDIKKNGSISWKKVKFDLGI